jgi:hypothetical protein
MLSTIIRQNIAKTVKIMPIIFGTISLANARK